MNRGSIIILICLTSFLLTAQTPSLIWAMSLGGIAEDNGYSIVIDPSGNVYTTGYFYGTADFDPGFGSYTLTSKGRKDIFISKLNANGNFLWAKSFGDTLDDIGGAIALDGVGNIYTTGFFQQTIDFDPGIGTFSVTSNGNQDAFILKLDASGNFVWAKNLGGPNQDYASSITVDVSGNVYSTGSFIGTADFEPNAGVYNITATGGQGVYISKLDASGNFVFAKYIGGTSSTNTHDIIVDASNNIYTTGYFFGITDFDPSVSTFTISAGNSDIFVSKLDQNGDFVWAKRFYGPSFDYGNAIAVDLSGNVFTTGSFNGTVDFDPNAPTYTLSSGGSDNTFISKLDANGNFLWAKSINGISYGIDLCIDGLNNIYTTGNFSGYADFDPSLSVYGFASQGGQDIFISKLDVAGNFVWAKGIGGSGSDVGKSITFDASGNVYTTGVFSGTSNFDLSGGYYNLTAFGNTDVFVCKMSPNPLGIKNLFLDANIKVYPNPVINKLVVELDILDKIVLTNYLGQLVFEIDPLFKKQEIDVSSFSKGIYFLKTRNSLLKIIIE